MYAYIKTDKPFSGKRTVYFAVEAADVTVPHIGIDTVKEVISEEDIDFGMPCFSSRLLSKVRHLLECDAYKRGTSNGVIYLVRVPSTPVAG